MSCDDGQSVLLAADGSRLLDSVGRVRIAQAGQPPCCWDSNYETTTDIGWKLNDTNNTWFRPYPAYESKASCGGSDFNSVLSTNYNWLLPDHGDFLSFRVIGRGRPLHEHPPGPDVDIGLFYWRFGDVGIGGINYEGVLYATAEIELYISPQNLNPGSYPSCCKYRSCTCDDYDDYYFNRGSHIRMKYPLSDSDGAHAEEYYCGLFRVQLVIPTVTDPPSSPLDAQAIWSTHHEDAILYASYTITETVNSGNELGGVCVWNYACPAGSPRTFVTVQLGGSRSFLLERSDGYFQTSADDLVDVYHSLTGIVHQVDCNAYCGHPDSCGCCNNRNCSNNLDCTNYSWSDSVRDYTHGTVANWFWW